MADTTITYDGKTTTVQSGKTATLPCSKKLMKGDVVVKAGQPTGSLTITTEGEYDVTDYKTVSVYNVVPSTPGLRYSTWECQGMGTATTKNICLAAYNSKFPVWYVSDSAFKGTDIESVIIPEGYAHIRQRAFQGCTSLKTVILPSTLTSIEYEAFEGCTSLTTIAIPPSVSKIGDSAFKNCTRLQNVIIPPGVTEIGNNAFENAKPIACLCIPTTVTKIGDYAFKGSRIKHLYYCNSTSDQWAKVTKGTGWSGNLIAVYCTSGSGWVSSTL